MVEHRFLRYLRSTLEVLVWLAAVFLVVVFARGAGIDTPPQAAVTGGDGIVTTYGIRMTLLLLFLIAGALMGLLFLLARFQRLYRYPVTITAKNVEVQYMLAKIMLSSLQIICATYFVILMVDVFNMTITLESSLFRDLTAGAAVAAAAVFGVYLLAARKFK